MWKYFQYLVGGTHDKRKLCLSRYTGQKSILEIGCSLGNIAQAFTTIPNVHYTGVDIDPVVIEYAKKSFSRHPNFGFQCIDIRELAKKRPSFDYVLLAGVLHHVGRSTAEELLEAALVVAGGKGRIVVVDPLSPDAGDSWLVRQFIKLEQGRFVRSQSEMQELLRGLPGAKILSSEVRYISGPPFAFPDCARFGVFELAAES